MKSLVDYSKTNLNLDFSNIPMHWLMVSEIIENCKWKSEHVQRYFNYLS